MSFSAAYNDPLKMKTMLLFIITLLFMGCAHISNFFETKDEVKSNPSTSFSSNEKSKLYLKKVWVKKTSLSQDEGYRKNVRMTPQVLKDRIIQGNAYDGVLALDRKSGQRKWFLPLKGGAEGGVTQVKDRLFFGSNDGYFYSVSAENGDVFWKTAVRSETLAAPLLYDGIVYFLTGNNVLHAVDALDGKELWIYSRVDNQSFSIRGASTPTVKDGALLIGFSDGYLVALDSKSGSLRWETLLNKNKRFRDIDSTPVVDGEFVYVTGYDSHLYCVNIKTGELVWKLEPGGFGKVALSGDQLFYSSSKGEVLAINKKDGSVVWRHKLKEGIATSPTLYKSYIVIGESEGALKILEKQSGKEVGRLSPGHGIFSPIAVDDEKDELYFISNSALLYKVKVQFKPLAFESEWM